MSRSLVERRWAHTPPLLYLSLIPPLSEEQGREGQALLIFRSLEERRWARTPPSLSPSLSLIKQKKGKGTPYVSLSGREEMGPHAPIFLSLRKRERGRRSFCLGLSKRRNGPTLTHLSLPLCDKRRKWKAFLISRPPEEKRWDRTTPSLPPSLQKRRERETLLISRPLEERRWARAPPALLSSLGKNDENGKHSLNIAL